MHRSGKQPEGTCLPVRAGLICCILCYAQPGALIGGIADVFADGSKASRQVCLVRCFLCVFKGYTTQTSPLANARDASPVSLMLDHSPCSLPWPSAHAEAHCLPAALLCVSLGFSCLPHGFLATCLHALDDDKRLVSPLCSSLGGLVAAIRRLALAESDIRYSRMANAA